MSEFATPPASAADAPVDGRGLVLLVDDEPLLLRALERMLRPAGHRIWLAESRAAIAPALDDPELDVVLLDLFLGEADGLAVLDEVRSTRPDVEVIVMTGRASFESAVASMRRGAFDYLAKPFDDAHRVRNAVHQAIERRRLLRRNRELESELRERDATPALIGASPAMRSLSRMVAGLRHNESTVLIQGESGTGKELVARAIHAGSRRRERPFVPVDCGSLPESIIESELFGHEKGAFTGAVGAPGLFRMADGGTLFLDEIGELPLATQSRLLRALQEREVRPVGASGAVPVDLRVIAATHRQLPAEVEAGRFRTDLFYRLNVVRLEVPPLRARAEDVPRLAHHFLEKYRGPTVRVEGFEPEALARLQAHDWPGNVRELENAVESALALAAGPRLTASDFRLGPSQPASVAPLPELPLSLDAFERCALERALSLCAGDVTAAARRLGIGRSTFYRKLAKHGLAPRRCAGAGAGREEAIR